MKRKITVPGWNDAYITVNGVELEGINKIKIDSKAELEAFKGQGTESRGIATKGIEVSFELQMLQPDAHKIFTDALPNNVHNQYFQISAIFANSVGLPYVYQLIDCKISDASFEHGAEIGAMQVPISGMARSLVVLAV